MSVENPFDGVSPEPLPIEHPEKEQEVKEGSVVESKEVVLKEKILRFQLEYAQRLSEKKIPSPSENVDVASMDFHQIIDNFTDLSKKVGDAYNQWKGEPFYGEHYQEFETKYKEVVSSIEEEYKKNSEGWIKEVDSLILNVLPKGEHPFQAEKVEESHAGVLRYDIGAGHGRKEAGIDISEEDICIKTHLDPLFMQEGISEGKSLSELYEESYRILAKEVAEKYPDARDKIKAIVSESWLFDTALVKKIGIIHTYPSGNEDMFRGTTFWGQFINKDGEINQERVSQLLETGKPPFRIKSMYIPMDEFMDKYGPKG